MTTAADLLTELDSDNVKMGDIKKHAKAIKRDHDLAMELWASEKFSPRMLAVLIMDKNQLTQEVLDGLMADLDAQNMDQRIRIIDWLLANQLMKSKKTIALLESWQNAEQPLQRRLFWYHQARLRWMGKLGFENTPDLVTTLESELASEAPEVQWAMNFTAGQIGVFDAQYRDRLVTLGKDVGLYEDEPVPRGCTPNYLPEFIRIEAEKRGT